MKHLLDYSVVGLIVLGALGYAAASLGPRSWRQGTLGALARATGAMPRGFGLNAVSQRLTRAAASGSQGACGGCDNCGSAAPQSRAPAGTDVKIRVGDIGRRVTH